MWPVRPRAGTESADSLGLIPKPFGMPCRRVEDGRRLVAFVLTAPSHVRGPRQQGLHLPLAERAEAARSRDRLLEGLGTVDPHNQHRDGKREDAVQTLSRSRDATRRQDATRQTLHADGADAQLGQTGQHQLREAPEMGIEDVERHLDSIEREAVFSSHVEHVKMDARVLVPREPDVAQLAGLPRLVIHRAEEVLSKLENGRQRNGSHRKREGRKVLQPQQLPLLAGSSPIVDELVQLEVDAMTPLEALTKLYELQEKAKQEFIHGLIKL